MMAGASCRSPGVELARGFTSFSERTSVARSLVIATRYSACESAVTSSAAAAAPSTVNELTRKRFTSTSPGTSEAITSAERVASPVLDAPPVAWIVTSATK